MELRQVFTTPDGKTFETKAEAMAYLRTPKIKEALTAITKNAELTDWLVEHREQVQDSFEVGTITRVSKQERKKLEKALIAIKEANNPAFAFVADNADAIAQSFRWPTTKRMSEDERNVAVRNTLTALSEGNEELAVWIVANKDSILAAYEAGVEKRQVNPKAAEALRKYQEAKKAAAMAQAAAEATAEQAAA